MLNKESTRLTSALRLLKDYGIPVATRSTKPALGFVPKNGFAKVMKALRLPHRTKLTQVGTESPLRLNRPMLQDMMENVKIEGKPFFKPKDLGRMGAIKQHKLLPEDYVRAFDDPVPDVPAFIKPSKVVTDHANAMGISNLGDVRYDPRFHSETMSTGLRGRPWLGVPRPDIAKPVLFHEFGHVKALTDPKTARIARARHTGRSHMLDQTARISVLKDEAHASQNALDYAFKLRHRGLTPEAYTRYEDRLRNALQSYGEAFLERLHNPRYLRFSLGTNILNRKASEKLLHRLGFDKYKNWTPWTK